MLEAIARPFGMLLMVLYTLVDNYGIAIFLFAFLIKLVLLPFQMKSKRGQIQQARLQQMIAELQKKHGANKTKLNEETMKLYRDEGVNAASGCIWSILPLPIMLALFQVIRQPILIMMGVSAGEFALITDQLEIMNFATNISPSYLQIAQAQFISANLSQFQHLSANLRSIDFNFLMNLNLGLPPQWDFLWNADLSLYGTWLAGFILFLIPFISGGLQYLSTSINQKINPALSMNEQANSMSAAFKIMPLFSIYFCFVTPAALGFYWTVSTVFQIIQDVWLTKVYSKKILAEVLIKEEERKRKVAEIAAKRRATELKRVEGNVERNPNTSKRKRQMNEKQEQIEKSVEWQKRNSKTAREPEYAPSRVDNRRYARGRAYVPERYGNSESEFDEASADELSESLLNDVNDSDAGDFSDDSADLSANDQLIDDYDDESEDESDDGPAGETDAPALKEGNKENDKKYRGFWKNRRRSH